MKHDDWTNPYPTLRSPLFGASEADLLLLAEAAGTAEWLGQPALARRSWWSALTSLASPGPVLARARTLLARWSAEARQRTPHELLDLICHEGDLLARIAATVPAADGAVRMQSVQALLQAALDLDGGRYAQLYGFVRALKSRALKLAAPLLRVSRFSRSTVAGTPNLARRLKSTKR